MGKGESGPVRQNESGAAHALRARAIANFECGVSPESAGLRRGPIDPGFRHAESVGDTRMLSCVIF